MKNERGFAEVVVLYAVIAVMALLFVPNPVSNFAGIGIKPNKTVQIHKETIEPLLDANGKQVAFKTVESDSDQEIQQHVTFWDWIKSLPIIILLLMGLGIFCPPLAAWLHGEWTKLTSHTKKIVAGVDAGLATLKDPAVKQAFLDEMTKVQGKNSPTESLVSKLQKS